MHECFTVSSIAGRFRAMQVRNRSDAESREAMAKKYTGRVETDEVTRSGCQSSLQTQNISIALKRRLSYARELCDRIRK